MEELTYIKMGELYLPLSGMFLFVFAGGMEEHTGIWEMISGRRRRFALFALLRSVFLSVLLLFFLFFWMYPIWQFSVYLAADKLFFGIYIDALFLGILGMVTADMTGSYGAGYLAVLGYYVLGTTTLTEILGGYFQLTGYLYGNSLSKYALGILTIVLLLIYVLRGLRKQRMGVYLQL